MSIKKIGSIALAAIILLQCLVIFPSAADLSKESSFAFTFTKAPEDAPGNILATMYCQTNPKELITTLGSTFVINTEYIDIVNKKGEATTDSYKKDFSTLGKSSTVAAAEGVAFTGFRGLSIASYNASSKLMYIFLCGMSMEGVQIEGKSKIATIYLNAKTEGKLPADSIRLLKQSEIGKQCPSKAVFVSEISSKEAIGETPSPVTLSVDESLMEAQKEPTTEAEKTTEAPSEKPEEQSTQKPGEETTQKPGGDEGTQQETTTAAKTPVTKKVQEMSEAEIKKEVQQKAVAIERAPLTETQKQSSEYKAYEKALAEAEKVLEDDSASLEQKQQALEKVRKAEKALVEKFPELAEKLEPAESSAKGSSKWLYIGIGAGVAVLAAVVIVLAVRKKTKTPNSL